MAESACAEAYGKIVAAWVAAHPLPEVTRVVDFDPAAWTVSLQPGPARAGIRATEAA
jgi:hypothetical protein